MEPGSPVRAAAAAVTNGISVCEPPQQELSPAGDGGDGRHPFAASLRADAKRRDAVAERAWDSSTRAAKRLRCGTWLEPLFRLMSP